MSQLSHDDPIQRGRGPSMLLGLICSSCGLGFTSEEELRDHQVTCRSTFEFLSQFNRAARRDEELN